MSVKTFAEAVVEGVTRYTRSFGIEQAEAEESEFATKTEAGSAQTTANEAKSSAEAVGTSQIVNLAVTAAKLAAEGVETGKIKLLAITEGLLANEAVGTGKIANLAVTAGKIANATITPKQLQGGATPAYNGKTEKKTAEEIEPSASERKLVTITVQTAAATRTVAEVVVNKVYAGEVSVAVGAAGESHLSIAVLVPAAQKFEVKVIEGKVEKVFYSAVTI